MAQANHSGCVLCLVSTPGGLTTVMVLLAWGLGREGIEEGEGEEVEEGEVTGGVRVPPRIVEGFVLFRSSPDEREEVHFNLGDEGTEK